MYYCLRRPGVQISYRTSSWESSFARREDFSTRFSRFPESSLLAKGTLAESFFFWEGGFFFYLGFSFAFFIIGYVPERLVSDARGFPSGIIFSFGLLILAFFRVFIS
ncbi:hypothetical protein B0H65DRAFT_467090 [Neurospora tetraspora]|uniref:Uncharacterized protein n=1 Tax=Neurospora tetraspora TaxID=94610 RepID=A0AAE0JFY2_9PEZI|nr:hypothetical protein B0H65DRAFT_467090 [Neurospora tetraspora]